MFREIEYRAVLPYDKEFKMFLDFYYILMVLNSVILTPELVSGASLY